MQVTRENKEAVKLFIKIPVDFKLSEEAVKMIVTMLQSEAQMDELAAFIAKNVDVTETALFERAAAFCRAGKTRAFMRTYDAGGSFLFAARRKGAFFESVPKNVR